MPNRSVRANRHSGDGELETPTHDTLDRPNTLGGDDTLDSDDTLARDDVHGGSDTIARDDAREEVSLLPVVDPDGSYEGLVTRDVLAPYLSRHRLEITWYSDHLSLAARETPDAVTPE